ncbi:MAG: LytTR family transcriptional regulator DNA-binding domain-containing protein [Prolixibacteraceae bacterium]|nr:LytTR family transcriptional regulator DNA-binding domain-containing protein [Prolixibacteraceae bacterium]
MDKLNLYRAIIFERSIEHGKIIKKQLKNDNRILVEGIYTSLRNIKSSLKLYDPDIVFIDSVNLDKDKKSKIFLSMAETEFQSTKVVLTYSDNVSESTVFNDYNPDYYLKKPFLFSDTIKIIDQIEETKRKEKELIYKKGISLFEKQGIINLKYRKGVLLINPSDIVYIRSIKKGCEIIKKDGIKETVKYSVTDLINVFEKFNFFRLTKSMIINLELLHMISRKDKKCVLKYFDNEYNFLINSRNVHSINKLTFINVG